MPSPGAEHYCDGCPSAPDCRAWPECKVLRLHTESQAADRKLQEASKHLDRFEHRAIGDDGRAEAWRAFHEASEAHLAAVEAYFAAMPRREPQAQPENDDPDIHAAIEREWRAIDREAWEDR